MNILNKKRQLPSNSTQQNQPKKKIKVEKNEEEEKTEKCFIQFINPDGEKKGEICEINSGFNLEKINEILNQFLSEVIIFIIIGR
jgi:hypothetical protein